MMKKLAVLTLLVLGSTSALAADTSVDRQALGGSTQETKTAKTAPCPCAGAQR
jgi:hypothetical protein